MSNEKRGRGRPKKEKGYDRRVDIRLSDEDMDMLRDINSEGIETSEFVRNSIRNYNEEKRGRGRPKKDDKDRKGNFCGIRMDPGEEAMLAYMESYTGKSRSDILRESLRKNFDSLREEVDSKYYD